MSGRSNRDLLFSFLYTDPVFAKRVKPVAEYPPETAHMQSMAQYASQQFKALSEGNCECKMHAGQIHNACPYCEGVW